MTRSPRAWRCVDALSAVGDVTIIAQCQNGFEAVKVGPDTQPDAMLLDVQMPKLDGFDVLELVGADVPVDLRDRATMNSRFARSRCTPSTTC
jgi:DNA-binding NarL/FixJ family response regulator